MTTLDKLERFIDEINRILNSFSSDCLATGKIEQIDTTQPLSEVAQSAILTYRLNLHETINDYLMKADVKDISYFYRVKTSESILDKLERFKARQTSYPVKNVLNDLFAARVILRSKEIIEVLERLDNWSEKHGLNNWYLRNEDGYIGLYLYFHSENTIVYPWELQIWDEKDVDGNIASHALHK